MELVPADSAAHELASNGGFEPGALIAETRPHPRWGITRRLRARRSAPSGATACTV